jgi:hypothetical protein
MDPSPPNPTRDDRDNFADKGDLFIEYLEGLGDELDELSGQMNTVSAAMNQSLIDTEAAQDTAELASAAAIAAANAFSWADGGSARAFAVDEQLIFTGGIYICVTATSAGESPATHPDKWQKISVRPPSTVSHTVTGNILPVEVDGTVAHDNTGASGEIILSWPTVAAGQSAKFVVTAAHYLRIKAPAGSTIRSSFKISVSGGYIRSNTVGDWIELRAISSTEIIEMGFGGTSWVLETT